MKYFVTLFLVLSTCMASAQSALNALQFDGSDDQVVATVPALFSDLTANDFTMEAWVKPQATIFSRIIFAQASTVSFAAMSTGVTNNIYFYVVENGINYSTATSATLPLNSWTHVAVRWTTATNSVDVFFNGVLQNGNAGGTSSTGTSGLLTLGARPGGAQYFNGTVDETRIWSEARSNCEILSNYQSELTGTESNLVTYYNFNLGVADGTNTGLTTLTDLVAANNGTLTNFALTGTTSNWTTSGATLNMTGEQGGYVTNLQANLCQGDSYSFFAQTLTSAGDYTELLTAVNGCDSLINLHLDVLNPTSSSLTVSECEQYTWSQNGEIYTTSGAYNDTIPNVAGCDSIITLNLTILNSTSSNIAVAACGEYVWSMNGETYTVSGNYNDTIPNTTGCDSIITLNLTINNSTSSTQTASACDSYTWAQNGEVYTMSGMYNDTIPNAAGCDSIITLNLTITNSTSSSESATACESFLWSQTNVTYNTSGMYTDTIPNSIGCDSIITLNLTINNAPFDTLQAFSCGPYYWEIAQDTLNFPGQYSWTVTGPNGCDSTQVLYLDLNTPPTANVIDPGNGTLQETTGHMIFSWVDCSTGNPVPGAGTASTFTPTANGTYAAVIYDGVAGCSDTSNCVTIDDVGLASALEIVVSIYPNPTNDLITVSFGSTTANFIVYDALGSLIRSGEIGSGETLSLKGLEPGVYFISLKTEFGSVVKQIIKQ